MLTVRTHIDIVDSKSTLRIYKYAHKDFVRSALPNEAPEGQIDVVVFVKDDDGFGVNSASVAQIHLDADFTILKYSGANPQTIADLWQQERAAAEIARTQAVIQHLATSESPDAKAARVYLRYLFTAINDLRELHGLPRKLEPEIRDELVAAADAGYGSPISLT